MKSLWKKLKGWFICGSKINEKYRAACLIYDSKESIFTIFTIDDLMFEMNLNAQAKVI